MPDCFYEPGDDGLFVATELTRGPWNAEAQHAGPPAALIGRELERLGAGRIGEDGPPAQLGRITFELLRSVPIAPLRVFASVTRLGRRVEMVEATLADARGEPLMIARGWRLRTTEVELGARRLEEAPRHGPEDGDPGEFFHTGYDVGYHTAMEYRFVAGAFMDPGPATVWMRMAVPLLPGEEPSPLQRVLAAADSGNGVSAALDWRRYLFINVDLSVHLQRMPEGEWVCLDAVTLPEPTGIGRTETALLDRRGAIGSAAQTLLVDRRASS